MHVGRFASLPGFDQKALVVHVARHRRSKFTSDVPSLNRIDDGRQVIHERSSSQDLRHPRPENIFG